MRQIIGLMTLIASFFWLFPTEAGAGWIFLETYQVKFKTPDDWQCESMDFDDRVQHSCGNADWTLRFLLITFNGKNKENQIIEWVSRLLGLSDWMKVQEIPDPNIQKRLFTATGTLASISGKKRILVATQDKFGYILIFHGEGSWEKTTNGLKIFQDIVDTFSRHPTL